MICPDCAAAADYEALPGLQKVVHVLDGAAGGHDLCFERNLGKPSPDCACQHRSPSEVSDGR